VAILDTVHINESKWFSIHASQLLALKKEVQIPAKEWAGGHRGQEEIQNREIPIALLIPPTATTSGKSLTILFLARS